MTAIRRRPLLLAPALLVTSCSLLPGKGPTGQGEAAKAIDKAAQTDPEPVLSRTVGIPVGSDFLWWTISPPSSRPRTTWSARNWLRSCPTEHGSAGCGSPVPIPRSCWHLWERGDGEGPGDVTVCPVKYLL